MLQYDGEPASQSKLAAPKTDKKDLTGINKEGAVSFLPTMTIYRMMIRMMTPALRGVREGCIPAFFCTIPAILKSKHENARPGACLLVILDEPPD
jgi:hypothetical protein